VAIPREVGKYEISSGEYVVFSISDTGIGMDDETMERIFEPFFTTKELGKGTGLGLATVYGIIKQSGGYVAVDSEKGKGSIFSVYMPKKSVPPVAAVKQATPTPSQSGHETVLLVEDEKPLREIMSRAFQSKGYRVVVAKDGAEALTACKNTKNKLELMVSDVMIPGVKGVELADKIKAMQPGISIIFISGYAGDVIGNHGILESDINFLPKPFDPDKLLSKARELLDAKRP
jgi:CheY-like chemotaxis protein